MKAPAAWNEGADCTQTRPVYASRYARSPEICRWESHTAFGNCTPVRQTDSGFFQTLFRTAEWSRRLVGRSGLVSPDSDPDGSR